MADKTDYKWLFDLIKCAFTTKVSNDYIAKVHSTGSITLSDIASAIAAERTDLRSETIEMVADLIDEKIIQKLCTGHTVVTGSAIFQPIISGTFTGKTGTVDSTKNRKKVSVSVSAALRTALEDVVLEYTGHSKDLGGAEIGNVTDSRTGNTEGIITPGGGLIIEGSKIKCVNADGSDTGTVSLTNLETNAVTEMEILTNEPRKLVVIIPSTLQAGSYTLQIETYYSTAGTQLKSARVIEYGLTLTVESATQSTTESSNEESDTSESETDSTEDSESES